MGNGQVTGQVAGQDGRLQVIAWVLRLCLPWLVRLDRVVRVVSLVSLVWLVLDCWSMSRSYR
jgi:hypothetical protein